MSGLLQQALGQDWECLPPALRLHYRPGTRVESGYMDIQFPCWAQPVFRLLGLFGILLDKAGTGVYTVVKRECVDDREHWQRIIHYPDGIQRSFCTHWELTPDKEIIEFVNPFLGLTLSPQLESGSLVYRSTGYVLRLGNVQWSIPGWLSLGEARIEERAIDERYFEMDFHLHHPMFGEIFRYAGRFDSVPEQQPEI